MSRARRSAWIAMIVADAGLLLWGAMAAIAPEHLIGPGSRPILAAGYEGYSASSWSQLDSSARDFMTILFRMYGIYIVAFGLMTIAMAATAFRRGERWAWWALLVGNTIAYVSAMTYDRVVHAIGSFELTEYLGLAVIFAALAVTARFPTARREQHA